jgi:hypothetical protein
MQSRPLGVTIIAILAILSGLGTLLKGLVILGLGGGAALLISGVHPVAGIVVGWFALVIGIIAIVIGLFTLAFGVGAWTLKPWAWALGVGTQIAAIVWSVLAIIGPGTIRSQFWHLVIALIILAYLRSPDVKAAFGVAA